ncbi:MULTISPECIES: PTS lactose/cellobiose transporter subunit IIA [Pelosinus]|uniref:Phosphotransferase system PTS lactose/cellobiose-specific IIA subunit n=1 Tax=Pelosinus fermentans B4 TaxID=1149862 RepID=I9LG81_9FIRM|nr:MULTISPECIES: PTS lactose/cellobiose transporter subunit IIA [Pelosinus]EIW19351.1 phosphotransferase system PTS lactose/cellobiose-specific IIA subunit [Pelosinus fermentans B4]EIW24918.1 phosphotransferase system PTS lactose/cellobiose-specific IIA subunit [Pelosinus fermentans A11]
MEHIAFTLILHAGNARSYCFEALSFARIGRHKEAFECLKESTKELQKAHTLQTNLLQTEAKGEKQEMNLLVVHAQDHLMNALLARDLIKEMIGMIQEGSS